MKRKISIVTRISSPKIREGVRRTEGYSGIFVLTILIVFGVLFSCEDEDKVPVGNNKIVIGNSTTSAITYNSFNCNHLSIHKRE